MSNSFLLFQSGMYLFRSALKSGPWFGTTVCTSSCNTTYSMHSIGLLARLVLSHIFLVLVFQVPHLDVICLICHDEHDNPVYDSILSMMFGNTFFNNSRWISRIIDSSSMDSGLPTLITPSSMVMLIFLEGTTFNRNPLSINSID